MHPEAKIQQKVETIFAKKPLPSTMKLWFDVIMYSIILFIVISLYFFVTEATYNLRTVNRTSADVSILLIGLSFILSGLCYYWNFADHYIIYRKQLGVVGFAYALIHTSITLWMSGTLAKLIPVINLSISTISLVSAEIAILIYAMMVLVSNRFVIHEIGGQRWRQLLRVGYVAVALSLIHFALKKYQSWLTWFAGDTTIAPPFGLLVFLFGVVVLVLRGILWFSTHHHPTTPIQPLPPQPTNV